MRLLRLVLVLSALQTACGGSSSTSPGSLAGTYDLQSIDGARLPYLLPSDGTTHTRVLDDQIVLHPNGTFAELGFYRTTWTGLGAESSFTVADSGRYVVSGSTAHFTFNSGVSAMAPIGGGRFRITRSGAAYLYVKK